MMQFKIWQIYDKQVWMLFLSRLLVVMSFCASMVFFSIYLHSELGISLRKVGGVMMISALISAFAMIISGGLCDRFGRKPLMWISSFVRALLFLALAYFIKVRPDFRIIIVLYILTRISGSLFIPASDAMLADIIEPKERVKAYGIMRIFGNTGFAIGPGIGGVIVEISYAYIFIFSSIISIIASFFILLFVKESLRVKKTERSIVKNILDIRKDLRLIFFCLASWLLFIVMGQFGVTFSIFSTEHIGISKAQLGHLFMLNGLMVIFFQYPITLLIGKVKTMRVLQISALIYAFGYFLVGTAGSFGFLALCIIIVTLGEMIFAPSANAIVANMAPEEAKGRYMGVFGLSRSFGWAVSPFIGGFLLHSFMSQGIILWGIIGLIGIGAASSYLILEKTLFKQ